MGLQRQVLRVTTADKRQILQIPDREWETIMVNSEKVDRLAFTGNTATEHIRPQCHIAYVVQCDDLSETESDIAAEPVRALHSVLILHDHSEMLAVALELFSDDGGGA